MTQRRKRYDRQFKVSAAKVVPSGEMTVKGLSEELGIKGSTPRRWACEYEETGDDAFPGNGSPKINKGYEIVKLKKKVEPGDPRLNLAERAFTVGERNRLWAGDITYMPASEGRLSRSRDRRLLPQGRGPVDVRAHHREGRDRCDRAGGWQGGRQTTAASSSMGHPRRAARLPFLPAMPGLAWHSPVGIKARHAAGQRGGRVVLQDAEKGIGGREGLWDEGRGRAGHLQVHRALLQ